MKIEFKDATIADVIMTIVILLGAYDRFPIYGYGSIVLNEGDEVEILQIDASDVPYQVKLIRYDKVVWLSDEVIFEPATSNSSLKMELIKLLNQLAAIIDNMED